jgi:hypothetical protein
MENTMKSILAALGLSAALGAAAQAQAQRDPAEVISRADANGDGAVSRDELRTERDSAFGRLDRNGDGFLSGDDAPRRRQAAGGERLDRARAAFDTDGDGQISEAEFVNGPMVGFDRADANKDSVVDAGELQALRAAAAAR